MEKREIDHGSLTEKKLCTLSKKGDDLAFSFLYRKHHKAVFNLINSRCKNHFLAEEICQLAWVKAWNKIGTFQGKSSLKTWVTRISLNCLWDSYKKKSRIVDIEELGGEEVLERILCNHSDLETPFSYAAKADITKKIEKKVKIAVGELPKDKRETVKLVYLEGLSYQEAAQKMNVPVGTVMSRAYYARKDLQEALKKTVKALSNDGIVPK